MWWVCCGVVWWGVVELNIMGYDVVGMAHIFHMVGAGRVG